MRAVSSWKTLKAPPGAPAPHPLVVRVQTIPPRHYFPEHSHEWHQLVYAIAGVLTVTVERQSFVISPEEAVWLPAGATHRVGSLLGAEFRSLWIARDAGCELPGHHTTLFRVSPLLRTLIVEAAAIQGHAGDPGYAGRVTQLILDQLPRVEPLPHALPWPRGGVLVGMCEAFYADPSDDRGPEAWGVELGMSARTLARRFETELGMSMRAWRRRLRVFKAVELLGGGLSVTQTALELGYGSPSAFIYAFRAEMNHSPQAYTRSGAIAGRHGPAEAIGRLRRRAVFGTVDKSSS